MGKKVDYSKKLKPIYIESIEANHIYINDCAEKTGEAVEYKIGKNWFEFKKIKTRKAVLTDSLFLRYMKSSITRNSGDSCKDFVVVKFNYDAEYRIENVETRIDVHDLRKMYYVDGVTYTFEKKNKQGKIVEKVLFIIKCLCVHLERQRMENVFSLKTVCIIRQLTFLQWAYMTKWTNSQRMIQRKYLNWWNCLHT